MEPKKQSNTKMSPIKQALLKIRTLQTELEAERTRRSAPIAVIGASSRLPGGSNSTDLYWENLVNGVDAVSDPPEGRFRHEDGWLDPNPDAPGKTYTLKGGFLTSDLDGFDPEFFRISPKEAVMMDPQQRLMLECAYEALESAGISPDAVMGSKTGVYVGICTLEYLGVLKPEFVNPYTSVGTAASVVPGRIAYTFGFKGPSMSVDTACSSSLVTVHLAVESLRRGEINMAMAGGIALHIGPAGFIAFSKTGMLSHNGKCCTFDDRADGYVRGEGCGLVVLKRLADAIRDGDPIMAVIRGSAVNQDGASGGLTVPNGPAQEEVIRQALASGTVDPADVDYVEAHGTGTALGDPIEVGALQGVYGSAEGRKSPLLIGSVKTNIGHLEGAAGVAGLIKLVLSLQNKHIPPHLNFKKPNSHIPWSDINIKVRPEGLEWQANGKPRIGAVSSFGFSGTNAHIVVEEAPQT